MAINHRTLQALQKKIERLGFHPFIRDGRLFVSAEHGDDAADYYGEYRGGYPWINPKLERLAKSKSERLNKRFYWDWQNAGCIVFCEA